MNSRIFRAVEGLLEIGRHPRGRTLLDLSVHDGTSSLRHQKSGFRVTPTAYDVSTVNVPGLDVVHVDLHKPMPFPDGQFDAVCLQEVIEHLENIPAALREIRRVMKPGGIFVLTTPNMLNLRSRMRFLFSGFYRGRTHPIPVGDPDYTPNWNIVPFHVWWWLAGHCGFTIEQLACTRVRPLAVVLMVLLYPFVALRTVGIFCVGKRSDRGAANRGLLRHLLGPDVLLSENLVMKMRRVG